MVEELIKKHTIDKLLKNAEKINIPDKSKYLSAYEEFIEYFNRIDTLTEHHTIIGISFTYSWMPTILHLYSDNVSIIKATEVLNKAKKGTRPNKEELELLKRCFNNSIVGTSKLLHFIDPDKYAIWDSKVYYYLFEKTSTTAPNNIDAYLNYLDFCDHLIKNEP